MFYGVTYVAAVATQTSGGDYFDIKSPTREYLAKNFKYLGKIWLLFSLTKVMDIAVKFPTLVAVILPDTSPQQRRCLPSYTAHCPK